MEASLRLTLGLSRQDPVTQLFKQLKRVSRMLGRFPADHPTNAGQQRLTVLKISEYLTSQVPSCCLGDDDNNNPLFAVNPNNAIVQEHRLTKVNNRFAVLRCRLCDKIWQRDVNAARYFSTNFRNIAFLFNHWRDGNREIPRGFGRGLDRGGQA